MKEATGGTFLVYWISIFMIITFAFLTATLSYMKAYKINARIVNAIEKFEGYNRLSNDEIDSKLRLWAYQTESSPLKDCPTVKGQQPINDLSLNQHFAYCVYEFKHGESNKYKYYNYGVRTYIYIELPIVHRLLKVPVYSETERIYYFKDFEK